MAISKLAVLATAAIGASVAFVTGATAAVVVTSHFVYVAAQSQFDGNAAYISNAATNDHPNSLLFVTPNWNVGGVCNCVYLPGGGPIGVGYDTSTNEWAVFREDLVEMPVGSGFNVLVVPQNKLDSTVFTVTANANNMVGGVLRLDNPNLNGNPAQFMQVTQSWNPGGGSSGVFNAHHIGVRYNATSQRWVIFNEDKAPMPLGASFNVLIGNTQSNGGALRRLQTSKSNQGNDYVTITNAQTTGNPNNVTFATQSSGTLDDVQIGVYYDGARDAESVFNEDKSGPPLGSGYNLLIFPS